MSTGNMLTASNKIRITLVIPFYNEEKYIHPTLKCLANQENPSSASWTVVFVNNGSTDQTALLIQDFCRKEKIPFIIIQELRRGTVFSRKTGLDEAAARGADILISTDADTTFPPNFIQATYNDFTKENIDVLVGRRKYHPKMNLWRRLIAPEIFNWQRKIWNLEYRIFGPYFFGAYFAIRADFYTKIPLFNPEIHEEFMGEDILLSRRCYYIDGRLYQSLAVVFPHDRRLMALGEKSFNSLVGNEVSSHEVQHDLREAEFIKMTPEAIQRTKRSLLDRYAQRVLWMTVDAYVFWEKTGRKYNNPYEVIEKSSEFNDIPLGEIMDSSESNQKKTFSKIKKRYLKQTKRKINEYLRST